MGKNQEPERILAWNLQQQQQQQQRCLTMF
jgi:hypothetical protein